MNKQHIIGTIVIALCLFAVYIDQQKISRSDVFEQWKQKFGVKFSEDQNLFRRVIFERNLALIQSHNTDQTQTYKMSINKFAGLSDAEFVANYLGSYPPAEMIAVEQPEKNYQPLVGDVDWTSQGKVTPVKDQGQCGSCWAFSATGVAESMSLLKGVPVLLSQQQLVDCSGELDNHGCNGGWPSNALRYILRYGLSFESEYPYVARDGDCKKQGGNFKMTVITHPTGCQGLTNGINNYPISVTVDATNWSRYGGGVFSNCGANINHAVLLVGMIGGNWKVKNSWGTDWGQNGYIRLAGGNTCGICVYLGTVAHIANP